MKKRTTLGLALSMAIGALAVHGMMTGAWSQAKKPAAQPAAAQKSLPADRSEAMKKFDDITRRALAGDYEAAVWHPIHFKPAIDASKQADCLTCHQEIMTKRPLVQSPAGQKADDVEAWYQTLETYTGQQETFHWRHLQSPLAKQVMNLECKFCHQGHDPREQSPHVTVAAKDLASSNGGPPFTLRKRVNPTETCLKCHGSFPQASMDLPGPWHEIRNDMEPEGTPNGCLTCHAEQFRTVRHQVNYLKAAEIEKASANSSDTCYGCHGGRSWYRISYRYPRTPWPGMPTDVPDWAKDRPTKSDPRHAISVKAK